MEKNKYANNDFIHIRHKTKKNENYYLTIFDSDGFCTINLANFDKNIITFGNSPKNDIVLSSNVIDSEQGYLELTDYGVLAVNTSTRVVMLGNQNKQFNDLYLSDGAFVKFIDDTSSRISGVVFIMSIVQGIDEWQIFPLKLGKNTLGSSSSCDIILSPSGVRKRHASINYFRNKVSIQDESSVNGTFVNGVKIPSTQEIQLNDLDVIFIGNSKLILHDNKIIYQVFAKGVQLDAIDIVKNVRIKFKTRQISSHVSMSIKPSEFVAFVGGSGAGKSTFMKCISGVDTPSSGTVLLNGENLYENYETLKYNIGYVPQDDIVYSNLTLYDMLNYAAKLRMPDNTSQKERTNRIKEVLEIVQLNGLENSYIRQLSGGQRKRASIAVELIADPGLFFLDEPTSGLDPGTERSIMQTLRKMSNMGKTIILVTHNTLNLHLCDKVAFFGYGGHLCFYGKPQEALDFFGVDDFVDIYTLLNENTEEWYEKFNAIQSPVQITDSHSEPKEKIVPKKKSFIKQLINLTRRYSKLILNNRMQLLILLLQAPIVAMLIAFVSGDDLYENYTVTKGILFSIGCACIWLGLLNSVQEICKERVILQKEHMAGLKLSAYLLSKFIVLGIMAFIQATILILVFQSIVGKATDSILIDSYWDIQIISFITILSASAQGLFISSLVKDASLALSLAPLLLVPQLLFSGILFELTGFSEDISKIILCRWTVEGFGTSVNLNETIHPIQEFNPLAEVDPESFFTFTSEHMIQVIFIISAMTICLMIASYFMLRKNVDKNM